MSIFKILIATALLTYYIPSNAQDKDFIVLVTNDTIYGDANSAKKKKDKFQIKIDGNKRIYEPDRITSYYSSSLKGKVLYEKIEVYDQLGAISKSFVERVNKHKGRVNIYIEYKISGGLSYSEHSTYQENGYILKNGKNLKPLPIGKLYFANNKTVKRLLPFLKDNPEIASEIEGQKLSKQELGTLIDKYNKSFDSQQ
ncbi:MAG: hypothetical protein AB8B59_00120 [Maribacter sp.]